MRFLTKTWILLMATIVAALGSWLFILTPLQGSFATIQGTIFAEETKLTALQSRVIDPQEQERQSAAVEEKMESLDKYYFSDTKALELFSSFERSAETAGVGMEFSLETASGNAKESIGMVFTIDGSFSGTMLFMQMLEHMETLIITDALTMTAQGETVHTVLTTRVFTPPEQS